MPEPIGTGGELIGNCGVNVGVITAVGADGGGEGGAQHFRQIFPVADGLVKSDSMQCYF